ncbi:hypothetical protein DL98DRAFT_84762 [Cadophora sp. DSE1049]|nr:hypothetical protein DL98DRAFT_84762 [Cadophora sp. DSE1049]
MTQTHKIPLSAHTLNNFLPCIHSVPVLLQTSKHDSHEPKTKPTHRRNTTGTFPSSSYCSLPNEAKWNHEGRGLRCTDHERTNDCIIFFCPFHPARIAVDDERFSLFYHNQAVETVYLRWNGNGIIGSGVVFSGLLLVG